MTSSIAAGALRWIERMMLKYMPLMITCREFEDFMLAYLDGELPLRQRSIFEFHLKICRECRDYLAAYDRARQVGKAVFTTPSAPVPEDVPEDLVKAVLEARGG